MLARQPGGGYDGRRRSQGAGGRRDEGALELPAEQRALVRPLRQVGLRPRSRSRVTVTVGIVVLVRVTVTVAAAWPQLTRRMTPALALALTLNPHPDLFGRRGSVGQQAQQGKPGQHDVVQLLGAGADNDDGATTTAAATAAATTAAAATAAASAAAPSPAPSFKGSFGGGTRANPNPEP